MIKPDTLFLLKEHSVINYKKSINNYLVSYENEVNR
jgi:hypothetical protein